MRRCARTSTQLKQAFLFKRRKRSDWVVGKTTGRYCVNEDNSAVLFHLSTKIARFPHFYPHVFGWMYTRILPNIVEEFL